MPSGPSPKRLSLRVLAALASRAAARKVRRLRGRAPSAPRPRDVRRADDLRVLSPFAESPLADVAPRAGDGRADAGDGFGQLRERVVHVPRRHDAPSPRRTGSSSSGRTAPTARSTTTRSRGRLAFYPLQQYLIRFPGARSGPERRLGRAAKGRGRPALVPSLPERERDARRRPPLDRPVPELELHVRRLPLDERKEGLRRHDGHLRDDVLRHRRLVRGLPRARLGTRRLGPGREGAPRGRRRRRRTVSSRCGSRATVDSGDRPRQGSRAAPRRARTVPRSRRAPAATRAAPCVADVYAPGRPLTDTHRPSLLDDPLYFAGRPAREEVYEYGSFLQSRMYTRA